MTTPSTAHERRGTEAILPPDGDPLRAESRTGLRVISGVIYFVVEEDESVLTPGDEAAVPAGRTARYWSAGDSRARIARSPKRRARPRRRSRERAPAGARAGAAGARRAF